jgi:hypothetical protein
MLLEENSWVLASLCAAIGASEYDQLAVALLNVFEHSSAKDVFRLLRSTMRQEIEATST